MNKIKTMTNWIERKDLAYWLSFIVLLWLLSSDFGKKNQPLLDNWSFASTIVSIILAVLAIVYTFAQSSMTLNTTKKLDDSAEKIEDVSNALKSISVDKLFDNLESKISDLESSLDKKVSKQFESHYTKVFGSHNKENMSPLDSEELLTKEKWIIYLKEFLVGEPSMIGITLANVYYKKTDNLGYTFHDFSIWFAERFDDTEGLGLVRGSMTGTLTVFQSLNLFTLGAYEDGSPILRISKNLEDALREVIEENKDSYNISQVLDFIKTQ